MPKRIINDNIVITTKVALNMMLKGKGGRYAVISRCLNKRIRLNVINNVSNNKCVQNVVSLAVKKLSNDYDELPERQ